MRNPAFLLLSVCFTNLICLFYVEVFGVVAQDEESDGAQPDVALKAWQLSDGVERAASERVLALHEAGVAWMLLALAAGDYVDISGSIVLTQECAEFVGTRHHEQIVVIKGPVWEVNVPKSVGFMVKLEMILFSAAKHALGHGFCATH